LKGDHYEKRKQGLRCDAGGTVRRQFRHAGAGPAVVTLGPERDAAIHRCIIQAQREYPDATNDEAQRGRTMAYKACMTAAGQVP
jgi:hypothetical protein